MVASYFYPPGILATITLLGYVIDISDVRWDFLSSQVAVAVCQVLDLLPVARVKTLRDRLDQPPLPLSACPDTKWGACWSKCDPCTYRRPMHDLWRCPWLHSEAAWACIPSPVVIIPDLVQGCSVENAEARGQGTVAAGSELAVLLSKIWAVSVAFFSQPCLPQIQLCTEVWSGWSWGALNWERNRWVLLWVLRMAVTALTRNTPQAHPGCLCVVTSGPPSVSVYWDSARRHWTLLQCCPAGLLTMASIAPPRPLSRPPSLSLQN